MPISLKNEYKIKRLQKDRKGLLELIEEMTKENLGTYDRLKDMSALSASKADDLTNRIIYVKGEIEDKEKIIHRIDRRILKLSKNY